MSPRKKETPARTRPKRRVQAAGAEELEEVRSRLERELTQARAPRWNANKDDVQRSVVRLVLTLVEFLRKLMERQAIRRMEEQTLTDEELEAIGRALMQLEETILELARQFEIPPEELNLDLGPLGKLI